MLHLVFENFQANIFWKLEGFTWNPGFGSLLAKMVPLSSKPVPLYPMAVVLKVQSLRQYHPEMQIHGPSQTSKVRNSGVWHSNPYLSHPPCHSEAHQVWDPLPYSSNVLEFPGSRHLSLVLDGPVGCGPSCRNDACAYTRLPLTLLGTIS